MADPVPIRRRTVLTGSLWAVPTVALATTTPAYAVSGTYVVAVTVFRSTLLQGEVSAVTVSVRDAGGVPARGVATALTVSGIPAFLEETVGTTGDDGTFSSLLRVRTICDPGSGIVTATAGSNSAAAAFTVVQRALITHASDGSSTTVIALPHGSQGEIIAPEARGMAHSDPQPTGRWVRAGDLVSVDVDGAPSWWLQLAIGSRGPMAVFGTDGSEGLSQTVLHGGVNTITADRDGVLFLINNSDWSSVTVRITGGRAQPVWVQGESTTEDFDRQLREYADAPMVTHVASRVFADVQRRVIDGRGEGASYDPAVMTQRLDRIRELTDAFYGLSYDAVGVARKHPGRIYIAGPDSGVAYAFATNQWLSLHVDSGASRALVTGSDLWVLWHEVGHTYQTPEYTWSGLLEVTVNISVLALQKQMTGENMLDESPGIRQRISRYLALPLSERDFVSLTAESPFHPLFLFDQLRRSFGPDFFSAVGQFYRVRRALGSPQPTSDAEKMDTFVWVTSVVANRDLVPFFREWGVPVSPETVAKTEGLPPLTHDIWTPMLTTEAPVETVVAYNPPTGTLSATVSSVYLGETEAPRLTVDDLSSVRGSRSRVVARPVTALEIGESVGRVAAVLESDEGTQDVLQRTVAVRAVSALEFVGFYDVTIGWIALSADASRYVATSLGNQAHPIYFADRVYYSVELRGADGQVRASAVVRGVDTADGVVTALNGQPCREGDTLVISAAEPGRVRVFQESARTGTLSSNPQEVLVSGGRFAV